MMYSHQFARPETLSRATFWLERFGLKRSQVEVDHRSRSIRLPLSFGASAGADSLINALELAEHEGRVPEAHLHSASVDASEPVAPRAPIGWHPDGRHPSSERGLAAMIEAILTAS